VDQVRVLGIEFLPDQNLARASLALALFAMRATTDPGPVGAARTLRYGLAEPTAA
jgi:hypothetical protein